MSFIVAPRSYSVDDDDADEARAKAGRLQGHADRMRGMEREMVGVRNRLEVAYRVESAAADEMRRAVLPHERHEGENLLADAAAAVQTLKERVACIEAEIDRTRKAKPS